MLLFGNFISKRLRTEKGNLALLIMRFVSEILVVPRVNKNKLCIPVALLTVGYG